jgi:hypothetical protein
MVDDDQEPSQRVTSTPRNEMALWDENDGVL